MLNKLRNALLLVVGVLVAFWAVTVLVDVVQGGDMDPPGPPGPTMLPLDEIPPAWHQILPADDGAAGPDPPAGCNSTRFQCVLNNEAVLDKETGLVWERQPNFTASSWQDAVNGCRVAKEVGGRLGWRLPTIEELASLLDLTQTWPALPNGHPFVLTSWEYWSNTTDFISLQFWAVGFELGTISGVDPTTETLEAWCVRGGIGAY